MKHTVPLVAALYLALCPAAAVKALDALEAHARGEAKLTDEQAAQASATVRRAAGPLAPGEAALRPRLALLMYAQIRDAFGWAAYKKVFAEYRALPREQRPRTDDQRRDRWLVRLSRTVGRDLGPFFQAWGVPTSEQARKSVAKLPPWMPENFPPKQ